MRPYTFKNAITIPANVIGQMSKYELNMNPSIQEDPEKFEPHSFPDLRWKVDPNKHNFVSILTDYSVNFSAGAHICPAMTSPKTPSICWLVN